MIELGQTFRIQIKIITEYQEKLGSKPALFGIHRYVARMCFSALSGNQ